MKHTIKSVVLGLSLLLANGSAVYAKDFNTGLVAYQKKDYATALNEWRPLAAQGDADAQSALGEMYYLGKGVPQDYKQAAKWHRLAAEQGNAGGQYSLGWLYENGNGVPQDYEQAAKWYRLAAEQGNADAQFNLATLYGNGTGVIKDDVYSHMWFNIAAISGDADALENRDIAAKSMTAAEISKAQDLARACLRKNFKGC